MVEENKSVLKTKLGLENLKGLGDTLKQIKEVKESLDEAQKTISELAKDNSPLGKALARLVEAQGLKTLNEDNVKVSEEMRKGMHEDLKNKGKTIEELTTENKGLKEDKVVREVTDSVVGELDRRLPKPGSQGNGNGENKLFKALEDVVADYLQKRLLGSGGEGALTGDQIRSVVREEVAKVATGGKKPEDMVDDIVNAVTMGDKLREKLGLPGLGSRLLSNQGGDSGLRTDLVKALLEDERERLKITQNHEVEAERTRHIGTIAETVKEHLGDGIAALRVAAEEIKESSGAKALAAEQPQVYECSDCHTKFSIPAVPFETIKCPNPNCSRVYTKDEVLSA
ncbi:unnamed protein product [marine sediment metagenome]|uniref:Uncharacterized protein n=2 Tax=marine sediment metagenome TaxID=412755 RepID=X1SP24_9ZZZZ